MAQIKATFYQFAKRENSTKRPTGGGVELTVTLKEETNLINPSLEVHYAGAFLYNYCYIDFTGRYYYVSNADSIAKDTYNLNLECDVLATWIEAVRGQYVYAAMSSYAFDEWLDDNRITTGHTIETAKGTAYAAECFNTPLETRVMPMTAVLAAITENPRLMGIDFLFYNDATIAGILSKFADLDFVQSLKSGSPWDAICEAYYVPFNLGACIDVSEYVEATKIWGIDVLAKRFISSTPKHYTRSFQFPVPSNIDFRFSEKYVKYYVNIPFSGLVQVPTSLVLKAYQDGNGHPTAYVTYSADPFTGQFACELTVAGTSLGIYGANLKMPFQLGGRQAQSSIILRSGVMGAITAATAATAAGVPMLSQAALMSGAVGGTIGAARGAVDIPPVESIGHYGGNAALAQINLNICDFYGLKVETDSNIDPATLTAIAGRPTEKRIAIANGFIQTINASVSFAGMSDEIRQFNSLLNGGIYVE